MKPRVIRVTSEDNHFQRAEVLRRNRVKRQRYGAFFVEGVTPINRAIACGWPMRALIYSTERRLSKWAQGVIANSEAERHLELTLDLMAKLSEKEEPSELLAILEIPPNDLARIEISEDFLAVVFDRPSNHGNLGTVIRSCDAFNADGLIVTGHAVDLYDPRTIRASVGSLFSVPVVRLPSHKVLLSWFAEIGNQVDGLQIVGTSASAEIDVLDADLTRPTVLLIGNETIGLSRRYKDLCDVMVRIPMYGAATSLNVACATSILLYEVDRQRKAETTPGRGRERFS
jgi:TrmH family RNA methyltransferase